MKGVTLRPSVAWSVMFGGQRVFSRASPHRYRGPLAIHVGRSAAIGVELLEASESWCSLHGERSGALSDGLDIQGSRAIGWMPDDLSAGTDRLPVGYVVGRTELVSVHPSWESCQCEPLHVGGLAFHYVIGEVTPTRWVQAASKLSLWPINHAGQRQIG